VLFQEGSVFSRFSPKRRRSMARSVIVRSHSAADPASPDPYNNVHKTVYRYSSNNSADAHQTPDAFTGVFTEVLTPPPAENRAERAADETTRINGGKQKRVYTDDILLVQRRDARTMQLGVVWKQQDGGGGGKATTVLHHDDASPT
jgi:hypothetical protein